MKVGFDLSRVVIEGNAKRHPDFVSNGNVFLPQSLDTLAALTQCGVNRVFIITRAKSDDEERRVWQWFIRHSFYFRTGIPANNVLFCRKRSEKRELCEQHGIDIFVDDRLEVLAHIADVVPQLVLFQGRKKEIRKDSNQPYRKLLDGRIQRVNSWGDLGKYLLH